MTGRGSARVRAPAKVNLYLRVLRKRADGFHELDTLFQAVDLCDEVAVSPGPPGAVALTVEGADVGPTEENLAYRAATAFLGAAGLSAGVEIHLVKRIPAGAGLGGGSSDAAAVLRCLDALHPGSVPPEVLRDVAGTLGSDVPFFLGPGALARGAGRGERLTAIPPLPPRWLVLVLPPVHVATGGAYGALARSREGAGPQAQGPKEPAVWSGPVGWDGVSGAAVNDFEEVVPAMHPEVARSLEALRREGAGPSLLSGSGAACFGVFATRQAAEEAAGRIAGALAWRVLAVSTLTELPAVQIG